MIAGLFNLSYPLKSYGGDIAGNISTYMCLTFSLFLLPCFLCYNFRQPNKSFKDETYLQKWGFLVEDIKVDKSLFTNYYVLWVSRRMIYVWIVFYADGSPIVQILFLLYTGLFMHVYIGNCPHTDRLLNRLAMLQEFMIMIVNLHFICFTDWVESEETKAMYGWSMLGLISAHIILELFIVFKLMYGPIKIKVIQLYHWYKGRNKKEIKIVKKPLVKPREVIEKPLVYQMAKFTGPWRIGRKS